MKLIPDPQYITNVKKGDSVTFGNGSYRIQEDKGWLHIVIKEKNKRRKIDVRELLFEYGSEGDYIFNGWYEIYTDYETFKTFAEHENIINHY